MTLEIASCDFHKLLALVLDIDAAAGLLDVGDVPEVAEEVVNLKVGNILIDGKTKETLSIVKPFIPERTLLVSAGFLLAPKQRVDIMLNSFLNLTWKYIFLIASIVV